LYGLTKDERYKNAIRDASKWLTNVQETDGSWERYAYNGQKHSYYSRVSAALYKAGMIVNDESFQKAALKHMEWVLLSQKGNGYFEYASFLKDVPAFLHTLVYILEGLLDMYEYTRDKRILSAVLKNADNFKTLNLSRDLVLCSQYDEDFHCVGNERCMTGLAQWLGVACKLYDITRDEGYKKSAIQTAFYLKAKQIKFSCMRGGFSASMPFWGRYGAFDFVNWTNKFFIDAMIEYSRLDISKTEEQESYVGTAFASTSSVVTDTLSYMDKKYIEAFEKRFDKSEHLRVLDMGCGKYTQREYLQYPF